MPKTKTILTPVSAEELAALKKAVVEEIKSTGKSITQAEFVRQAIKEKSEKLKK